MPAQMKLDKEKNENLHNIRISFARKNFKHNNFHPFLKRKKKNRETRRKRILYTHLQVIHGRFWMAIYVSIRGNESFSRLFLVSLFLLFVIF